MGTFVAYEIELPFSVWCLIEFLLEELLEELITIRQFSILILFTNNTRQLAYKGPEMFIPKMRVIGQTLFWRSHFDNKSCTCNLRI